jgi:hypothetical protein
MKEYLFLFRGGDAKEIQHSPDRFKAHMDKWREWMSNLAKQGQFVSAQPLNDTGMQLTGTKKIVSDGPYMEGKEYVGGYLVCLAEDYNRAVEIAKGCPILEFDDGVIEVREVRESEQPVG